MNDDYKFYLTENEEKEMLETLPNEKENDLVLEF